MNGYPVRESGFCIREIEYGIRHSFGPGMEDRTRDGIRGMVGTPGGHTVVVYVRAENETYDETRERVLDQAELEFG